jgi:hypothetical protein
MFLMGWFYIITFAGLLSEPIHTLLEKVEEEMFQQVYFTLFFLDLQLGQSIE